MIVNSVSSIGFNGINRGLKAKQQAVSAPSFEGLSVNKKALKGISLAALLGMATVMGCNQPTTPTYDFTIEQEEPTTPVEDESTDATEEEQLKTPEEESIQVDDEQQEPIVEEVPDLPVEEEPVKPVIDEEVPVSPTEENPITPTEEPTTPVEEEKTQVLDEEQTEPVVVEEESTEPVEIEEDVPVINVTRTEQATLFKDEKVKAMFDILGLNTNTKKSELKEGAYTPYSGDVLHMEFNISYSTKQVYDLILEESTPDKLVYKNSLVYIKSPSSQYSYKSTFEKTENGDIIRKDSTDPAHYYKYEIVDDTIRIDTVNSENDEIDYRQTTYYQKGEDSSEFVSNRYNGFLKFHPNASVTVEE